MFILYKRSSETNHLCIVIDIIFMKILNKLNMKKNILILLIISAAFFFTSCKKSEEATCTLSASTIVGTYKATSAKINGVDLFPLFDACQKDDTYTFNANGSYVTTDAGVVCTPNNNDTGLWSIVGNSITIDGETSTVSDFNCNGFTITATVGGNVQVGTFVRQ
jgi:hypothetical protein